MEESIKIQEEFENLIEQLERLKNINELTSANTESSQQVIKQMDKFVLSTNEYKKKFEEDLRLKSQSIDKLIIHLEKSIDSIDKQSQSLSKSINSAFGILKVETGTSFASLSEVVSSKIEINQKSVGDLKINLVAKIENTESNLIESSTRQIEIILNKIELNQKSVGDLKTNLVAKIENTKNNLIQSSTKQIETLDKQLTKNKTDITNRLETQDKELKILKIFLFIICGLIAIYIIVTIIK